MTIVNCLCWLIFLAGCIWITRDSARLMRGLTEDERLSVSKWGGRSPGTWLFGFIFAWPLILPWYLIVRPKYKRLQATRSDRSHSVAIQRQRYRVVGVHRKTGAETVHDFTASNQANARVMAELQGLVVTSVTLDT
jgi:hypothetical protein